MKPIEQMSHQELRELRRQIDARLHAGSLDEAYTGLEDRARSGEDVVLLMPQYRGNECLLLRVGHLHMINDAIYARWNDSGEEDWASSRRELVRAALLGDTVNSVRWLGPTVIR